ncbi:hypothetical protein OGAPHI_002807 [Ogataea philodendri]|uniref:Uncharacterized protein n=1 Tax=Ogataea philodendri TaxID=1378263 RepID=A0A9P8T5M4_9ASCO|nr:uncharacterized protein OGAPHI_002807 [Ogataea philodendri]KAH3667158.1 hypothetical protein OGAPHI_002807 [Ogataea philodendri]
MNSSTNELASTSFFTSTSPGSDVSLSIWTFTSGEARFKAPARSLFCFNFLDNFNKIRIPLVRSSCCDWSSIRNWACSYAKASLDRMIDLNCSSPFCRFSGTFQSWPSFGRQSKTFLENGRYSTSCSSKRASCSASLSSMSPKTRTKWPSGYLELAGHESTATTILLPLSSRERLVRIRILGNDRSIKITKHDFAAFPVFWLLAAALDANCPTYSLQLLFTIPTTRAVGITLSSCPCVSAACWAKSFLSWSEIITSFSSSSPTSFLFMVSSSTISVEGFFHLLWGSSSTMTESPLKLLFRFSRPRISNGLGIDGTDIDPSRKLYDEILITPWYNVPFLIPPIKRAEE